MSTEIRAKCFPFYFWSNRPRHVGRSQGQHLLRSRGKWHASWWLSPVPDARRVGGEWLPGSTLPQRVGGEWPPGSTLPRGVQGPHCRAVAWGRGVSWRAASLLRVKPVRSSSGLCAQGSETQAQGRKTGCKASLCCVLPETCRVPACALSHGCTALGQGDCCIASSAGSHGLMGQRDNILWLFTSPSVPGLGSNSPRSSRKDPTTQRRIGVFPGGTTLRTEAGCWQGAGLESSLRKKHESLGDWGTAVRHVRKG